MDLRPTKDEDFMTLAWAARRRGTCVRRTTGCVLVNGLGHVIGSGRNGRPSGYDHCNEVAFVRCGSVADRDLEIARLGETGKGPQVIKHSFDVMYYPTACTDAFAPVGSKPARCEAIHAELNALNQCYDRMYIDTCYVTRSPCIVTCLKALLQTSCRRIVFAEKSSDHDIAKEMWMRNNGRKINPMIPTKRSWDYFQFEDPFTVIDQQRRQLLIAQRK